MMTKPVIKVESPNVREYGDFIESDYTYDTTEVRRDAGNSIKVFPRTTMLTFRTQRKVPRLGLMLVGWGGNNGSTVTAAILANKLGIQWRTKDGMRRSNYFGSITQSSTVFLGMEEGGKEAYAPLSCLLPMVDPNDIVVDGWDISSMNLADAMERACVLDFDLQRQLKSEMERLLPRKSIYDKDFIAANQEDRADNIIKGLNKTEQIEAIRADIRDFKKKSGVEKVIVLWTANTERFCSVEPGLNGTKEALLESIKNNNDEISPSTLFAVASIMEKCSYINGSPQNTMVPGVIELAEKNGVFIGGDDFKSGQTKFKSAIVDFLVGAGIKPVSIVSYNHLGNNDGKNLSAPEQFRSKEISKSNVVDDLVASNKILYPEDNDKPDHCVVIKYVPYVKDSKRAMDEYTSEIMMGGTNTISVHNTCEDSLLAAPIILDLAILTELFQRVTVRVGKQGCFQPLNAVLSVLSYLLKAPLVPSGAPVVNSLFRQRSCIENVLRACIGLAPVNHMGLEYKLSESAQWKTEETCTTWEKKPSSAKQNGHDGGDISRRPPAN